MLIDWATVDARKLGLGEDADSSGAVPDRRPAEEMPR